MMHRECSWCIMWCIMTETAGTMIHHECSRCVISIHAGWWVIMMHRDFYGCITIMQTHGCSWCTMRTHDKPCAHDASWVLKMHHEYSWWRHDRPWYILSMNSWCIMGTHAASMRTRDASGNEHQGYPWCTLSTLELSWVLVMHQPFTRMPLGSLEIRPWCLVN